MRWGWELSTGGKYYRFPKLPEIEAPASTIFVGESGSYGRLGQPWFWNTDINRGGTTTKAPNQGTTANTNWEWPDMHSGGANYVFCDGHAKWLRDSVAYPPGMAQGYGGSTKAAYKACVDYFAATGSERAWCQTNAN